MKMMRYLVLFCGMLLMASGVQAACKVGDAASVEWKGKWYPAKVTKVDGEKCCIHYDGYGNEWDECVGPERIKVKGANPYPAGTPVSVEWKGSWYPAKVLEAKENSWKIHYDNYDSSWDEWVGPNRIKK